MIKLLIFKRYQFKRSSQFLTRRLASGLFLLLLLSGCDAIKINQNPDEEGSSDGVAPQIWDLQVTPSVVSTLYNHSFVLTVAFLDDDGDLAGGSLAMVNSTTGSLEYSVSVTADNIVADPTYQPADEGTATSGETSGASPEDSADEAEGPAKGTLQFTIPVNVTQIERTVVFKTYVTDSASNQSNGLDGAITLRP
jgi:hypothetical protein